MPKSILIADDSKAIRTATCHFVESQNGLEVCGEAVDGVDAVDKALQLGPDLIILDLAMPRMNGLEAAHQLRAMFVHVPIILFTMFADQVRTQDALASGVSAVVSKMNLPGLQQNIERLLTLA